MITQLDGLTLPAVAFSESFPPLFAIGESVPLRTTLDGRLVAANGGLVQNLGSLPGEGTNPLLTTGTYGDIRLDRDGSQWVTDLWGYSTAAARTTVYAAPLSHSVAYTDTAGRLIVTQKETTNNTWFVQATAGGFNLINFTTGPAYVHSMTVVNASPAAGTWFKISQANPVIGVTGPIFDLLFGINEAKTFVFSDKGVYFPLGIAVWLSAGFGAGGAGAPANPLFDGTLIWTPAQ